MDLSLSTRTEGDRTVVVVGGEIDVYTAPKLREQLIDLVSSGQYHLVVDMEGVEFLDSTGLGVLVGGLKRVRAHEGSLRLVCTQERILKIFRITGLTKVFPIHASVEEAVAAGAGSGEIPSRRAGEAASRGASVAPGCSCSSPYVHERPRSTNPRAFTASGPRRGADRAPTPRSVRS